MRVGRRFGITALVFGVAALVSSVGVWYAESRRGLVTSKVLEWASALGLVSPVPAGTPDVLTGPGILATTDPIAMRWLLINSTCFAAFAVLAALWAEARREDTLYMSMGFMCGAVSLVFVSLWLSLATMVLGAVAVTAIRRVSTLDLLEGTS